MSEITQRHWKYTDETRTETNRQGYMLSLIEWHGYGDFMPAKFTSLGGKEWFFDGECQ